jgi:hypothetical protein
MADAATLLLDPNDTPVLRALRRLKGRATVGDVSAATGLAQAEAEASLRRLLEGRQGHLEVGERGDLVYAFEPGLLERGRVSAWTRLKRAAWAGFKVAFKVWIVTMLVVYFVIFVALLIAALFANRDGEGGWGGGEGRGRRGGGHAHFPMGDMLFWYWIWSPGWRRRPYYGEGYGRQDRRATRERRRGPPFYKKVFAFVFGPDEPRPPAEQKDRELLRFARARRGVVTAAELVQQTGMGLDEAESELARLMAAHEGDVKVSDDGTLLYVFPGLMVSAHGGVDVREPPPAWRRLEPRQPLTGNSAGTNTLIAGINAFNMAAAATAPLFIFPRLGLGGTAAEVGLIWVPVVFSTMFFAVPAARWLGVARENTRRAARNVRKVLMGLVSKVSLGGPRPDPVAAPEALARVREALPGRAHAKVDVGTTLDRLVAEFDGEVEAAPDGSMLYSFPAFRRQVAAAHAARRELALEQRRVGKIVYSSGDDAAEESRRDLEAFDRELAAGEPGLARERERAVAPGPAEDAEGVRALPPADDLSDYLNDPLRFDFRDERELAALADEMKSEARGRATAMR